jgi:hypothetical protein
MSTIHTGNTTTTGFSVTSDVTGRLVIKTGGSGGTTALTVGEDQRVTFANQPVVPVPTFSVELVDNQTFSVNTDSKIRFDTVNFDTDSHWDSTNYRYTPQVAGYYQFNTLMRTVYSGGLPTSQRVMLFKNGTVVLSGQYHISGATVNNSHTPLSHVMFCNGSTDYIEVFGWCSAGPTSAQFGGSAAATIGGCFFSGFLVRAT